MAKNNDFEIDYGQEEFYPLDDKVITSASTTLPRDKIPKGLSGIFKGSGGGVIKKAKDQLIKITTEFIPESEETFKSISNMNREMTEHARNLKIFKMARRDQGDGFQSVPNEIDQFRDKALDEINYSSNNLINEANKLYSSSEKYERGGVRQELSKEPFGQITTHYYQGNKNNYNASSAFARANRMANVKLNQAQFTEGDKYIGNILTSIGTTLFKQNQKLSVAKQQSDDYKFNVHMGYQKGILKGVNAIVNNLQTVQSRYVAATNEYQAKSLAMFQEMYAKLNDINKGMLVALPELINTRKLETKDMLNDKGHLKADKYLKSVYGNAKDIFSNTALFSLFDSKEDKEKRQAAGGSMLGSFTKKLAGPHQLYTLSKIDEALKVLPSLFLGNMNALTRFGSSKENSILNKKMLGGMSIGQLIGHVFGSGSNYVAQANFGLKDPNTKVSWTAKSDKTLNYVIPKQLSEILSALTGNEAKMYDYSAGGFKSESSFKREIEREHAKTFQSHRTIKYENMARQHAGDKGYAELDKDLEKIFQNIQRANVPVDENTLKNPSLRKQLAMGTKHGELSIQQFEDVITSKEFGGFNKKMLSGSLLRQNKKRSQLAKELSDKISKNGGFEEILNALDHEENIHNFDFSPLYDLSGLNKNDFFYNFKLDKRKGALESLAQSLNLNNTQLEKKIKAQSAVAINGEGGVEFVNKKGLSVGDSLQNIYKLLLKGIYTYEGPGEPTHISKLLQEAHLADSAYTKFINKRKQNENELNNELISSYRESLEQEEIMKHYKKESAAESMFRLLTGSTRNPNSFGNKFTAGVGKVAGNILNKVTGIDVTDSGDIKNMSHDYAFRADELKSMQLASVIETAYSLTVGALQKRGGKMVPWQVKEVDLTTGAPTGNMITLTNEDGSPIMIPAEPKEQTGLLNKILTGMARMSNGIGKTPMLLSLMMPLPYSVDPTKTAAQSLRDYSKDLNIIGSSKKAKGFFGYGSKGKFVSAAGKQSVNAGGKTLYKLSGGRNKEVFLSGARNDARYGIQGAIDTVDISDSKVNGYFQSQSVNKILYTDPVKGDKKPLHVILNRYFNGKYKNKLSENQIMSYSSLQLASDTGKSTTLGSLVQEYEVRGLDLAKADRKAVINEIAATYGGEYGGVRSNNVKILDKISSTKMYKKAKNFMSGLSDNLSSSDSYNTEDVGRFNLSAGDFDYKGNRDSGLQSKASYSFKSLNTVSKIYDLLLHGVVVYNGNDDDKYYSYLTKARNYWKMNLRGKNKGSMGDNRAEQSSVASVFSSQSGSSKEASYSVGNSGTSGASAAVSQLMDKGILASITKDSIIESANSVSEMITISDMTVGERSKYIDEMDKIKEDLISAKRLSSKKKVTMMNRIVEVRDELNKAGQRNLYTTKTSMFRKDSDEVPRFNDIVKRDNLIETANEVEQAISNMTSISDKKKERLLLDVRAIKSGMKNTIDSGKMTKAMVNQYERRLRVIYTKATGLNANGSERKLGGIVGTGFNLVKHTAMAVGKLVAGVVGFGVGLGRGIANKVKYLLKDMKQIRKWLNESKDGIKIKKEEYKEDVSTLENWHAELDYKLNELEQKSSDGNMDRADQYQLAKLQKESVRLYWEIFKRSPLSGGALNFLKKGVKGFFKHSLNLAGGAFGLLAGGAKAGLKGLFGAMGLGGGVGKGILKGAAGALFGGAGRGLVEDGLNGDFIRNYMDRRQFIKDGEVKARSTFKEKIFGYLDDAKEHYKGAGTKWANSLGAESKVDTSEGSYLDHISDKKEADEIKRDQAKIETMKENTNLFKSLLKGLGISEDGSVDKDAKSGTIADKLENISASSAETAESAGGNGLIDTAIDLGTDLLFRRKKGGKGFFKKFFKKGGKGFFKNIGKNAKGLFKGGGKKLKGAFKALRKSPSVIRNAFKSGKGILKGAKGLKGIKGLVGGAKGLKGLAGAAKGIKGLKGLAGVAKLGLGGGLKAASKFLGPAGLAINAAMALGSGIWNAGDNARKWANIEDGKDATLGQKIGAGLAGSVGEFLDPFGLGYGNAIGGGLYKGGAWVGDKIGKAGSWLKNSLFGTKEEIDPETGEVIKPGSKGLLKKGWDVLKWTNPLYLGYRGAKKAGGWLKDKLFGTGEKAKGIYTDERGRESVDKGIIGAAGSVGKTALGGLGYMALGNAVPLATSAYSIYKGMNQGEATARDWNKGVDPTKNQSLAAGILNSAGMFVDPFDMGYGYKMGEKIYNADYGSFGPKIKNFATGTMDGVKGFASDKAGALKKKSEQILKRFGIDTSKPENSKFYWTAGANNTLMDISAGINAMGNILVQMKDSGVGLASQATDKAKDVYSSAKQYGNDFVSGMGEKKQGFFKKAGNFFKGIFGGKNTATPGSNQSNKDKGTIETAFGQLKKAAYNAAGKVMGMKIPTRKPDALSEVIDTKSGFAKPGDPSSYLTESFGQYSDMPQNHLGIDIGDAQNPDAMNYAILDGEVVRSQDGWDPSWGYDYYNKNKDELKKTFGDTAPFGNHVTIRDKNGAFITYAHQDSNFVKVGDKVRAGQAVGKMGNTGNSMGKHLHLQVYKDGKVVDPLEYMASGKFSEANIRAGNQSKELTKGEKKVVGEAMPAGSQSLGGDGSSHETGGLEIGGSELKLNGYYVNTANKMKKPEEKKKPSSTLRGGTSIMSAISGDTKALNEALKIQQEIKKEMVRHNKIAEEFFSQVLQFLVGQNEMKKMINMMGQQNRPATVRTPSYGNPGQIFDLIDSTR